MAGSVVDRSDGEPALNDLLREMKERNGYSYEKLARKTFISRSTLHRYCTGRTSPPDADIVTRIAHACRATPEELRRVLQAWLIAERESEPAPSEPALLPAAPPVVETTRERTAVEPPGRMGRALRKRSRITAALFALATALTVVTSASSANYSLVAEHGANPTPQWITGPSWAEAPVPVDPAMFGVTIVSDTGEMPAFKVGAVRFWDSNTRWAQLQPRRGEFDWTTLDRLVAGANRAGLPALFAIGGTPEWAAPNASKAPYGDGSRAAAPDHLSDWDAFVRALVHRYRGRIEAYELWALANDPRYFTSSMETLVEMTRRASRLIKKADPRAAVVCPGMGRLWKPDGQRVLERFAELGGYQYCDVAGIKLYQRNAADPPETMLEVLNIVDRTMHQVGVHPVLWSTGTTFDIALEGRLNEQQAIDYAVRFYLTGLYGRELNLRRMYFYSWGNTKIPIVLQAEEGAPTKAALAVEELQRRLAHARIQILWSWHITSAAP
jgi:transcriptional regulator with XRE-family HTH domain